MLSSVATFGLAALHALAPRRYGPRVTATKDVGRNYLRGARGSMRRRNRGMRERERRVRQIAAGRLREANGLVREAAL